MSLATSRGNSRGNGTACNYVSKSRNRDVEVGGEMARDWGRAPESAAWRPPLRHGTRKGRSGDWYIDALIFVREKL
ncbi:MAG TPA: hypothetical protein VG099_25915, partial [Gemmataceae bacterium]|nr:hypothetical protein [Gemmataceae bacterium]